MSDRIDQWEKAMEIKGLLPNTRKLYRRILELCEAEVGELSGLGYPELDAWIVGRGGSASSISNRMSALRSFYRWQVRTERRDDDPTLKFETPKRRKGVPKPVRDLGAACAVLDDYDRRRSDGRWPVGQSRAMAEFLAYTGLRIHEAVGLNVSTPAPRRITIIGKGHKEAFITLVPKAREALDFLGGKWPIGARATQRRFERAGFTPHQCRHWRATSLVKAKVELGTISKIMRHSNMATTMIYAEYDFDTIDDALDRVG